jgi:hypothetical protein
MRTSISMQTKSLLETITYAKEHLYGELGLMIQGKTQMTKTLIDTTWQGLEAKIAEALAQSQHGGGTGTSVGAVKP